MSRATDGPRRFLQAWLKDDIPQRAAAMAYYAVFSLPSLLLIVIAVGGLLAGDAGIRTEAFAAIDRAVTDDVAQLIKQTVTSITSPGRSALMTVFGAVALVVGGSGVIRAAQRALNQIAGDARDADDVAMSLIRALLVIPLISLLLVLALATTTLLSLAQLQVAAYADIPAGFVGAVNALASGLSLTALLAVLYIALSPRRLPARSVILGAASATALIVVARTGIGLYVGMANVGAVYGVASSMLVLLLWIYVGNIAFLTGAEIAFFVSPKRKSARSTH
jgi:membrane protein